MTEYYALYVDGNRHVIKDILKEDTVSDEIQGYTVKQKYNSDLTLEEYASMYLQTVCAGECIILHKIGTKTFEPTNVVADMNDGMVDLYNLLPKSRNLISQLICDFKDSSILGGDSRANTYSNRYGKIYVTVIERKNEHKIPYSIIIKNGDEILANIYKIDNAIFIEEFKEDCGVFTYIDHFSKLDNVVLSYEEWFKFIEHTLGDDVVIPRDEDASYIITKHLKEMGCDNVDKVCKELKHLKEISNSSDFAIIAHDIKAGKSEKPESGWMKAINAMVGK